jgi:hypothetical protein
VRNKSAAFKRKGEISRRFPVPFFKSLRSGQPVKGHIQFNSIKDPAIIEEPILLYKIFRIKPTLPVLIIKSAATDSYLWHMLFYHLPELIMTQEQRNLRSCTVRGAFLFYEPIEWK